MSVGAEPEAEIVVDAGDGEGPGSGGVDVEVAAVHGGELLAGDGSGGAGVEGDVAVAVGAVVGAAADVGEDAGVVDGGPGTVGIWCGAVLHICRVVGGVDLVDVVGLVVDENGVLETLVATICWCWQYGLDGGRGRGGDDASGGRRRYGSEDPCRGLSLRWGNERGNFGRDDGRRGHDSLDHSGRTIHGDGIEL